MIYNDAMISFYFILLFFIHYYL